MIGLRKTDILVLIVWISSRWHSVNVACVYVSPVIGICLSPYACWPGWHRPSNGLICGWLNGGREGRVCLYLQFLTAPLTEISAYHLLTGCSIKTTDCIIKVSRALNTPAMRLSAPGDEMLALLMAKLSKESTWVAPFACCYLSQNREY